MDTLLAQSLKLFGEVFGKADMVLKKFNVIKNII